MTQSEKILNKYAKKNMVEWNQDSFKKTHVKLYKSIIQSIDEALRQYPDNKLICKCPICGNEMMGVKMVHYKCNRCDEYFTN